MAMPGRWAAGLSADMSAVRAAAVVVEGCVEAVCAPMERAVSLTPGSKKSVDAVHALRVAARRGVAALDAFAPVLAPNAARKLRARLRKLRTAAGEARDCDVQARTLGRDRSGEEVELVRESLREARTAAQKRLERVALKHSPEALRKHAARATEPGKNEGSKEAGAKPPSLRALAREAVRGRLESVRRVIDGAPLNPETLHAARVRLKKMRYTLELFGSCVSPAVNKRLHGELVGVQDALGEISDLAVLLKSLKAKAHNQSRLAGKHRRRMNAAVRAFSKGWPAARWRSLLADVEAAFPPDSDDRSGTSRPGSASAGSQEDVNHSFTNLARGAGELIEAKPTCAPVSANGKVAHQNGSTRLAARQPRIAAVDIGSNSVRLIVAEASPGGSYRVLDDEKEITRLGRGLAATGRLDAAAIEHTLVTVERMVSIARGYGADRIRIVGTAAAREAANGRRLRDLIHKRVGIELEVISGEQEAMLAYESAARAFNLAEAPSLVIDIGGGSTELVLSGPGRATANEPAHGVVERVWSIPIGAVRLTELFGGPERASGRKFKALRRHVRHAVAEAVGKAPIAPGIVVGTGGTLTTLGSIVMAREVGGSGSGLFGASVQGREVSRADLKHTLDYLRKLPLKDRVRVPGLPADRADIIVPGLVIVDAVLRAFGANALRVHDGGIRDGLLHTMVGETRARGDGRNPMGSVRRFARSCNYERAHAEHVTHLALQIFDQFRDAGLDTRSGGLRFDDEARSLLEAAGVLHDVGYLISYSAHHKHSYHLIVHADLPGWTTRQVQMIANIARYHRGAEPRSKHAGFGVLAPEDRELVRALGAVLRIADGLDRTHIQRVRSVRVRADEAVHFEVDSAEEPAVELWGAARKSALVEKVFRVIPHFGWSGISAGAARRKSLVFGQAPTTV